MNYIFPLTVADWDNIVDLEKNPYIDASGNFIEIFSFSGTLLRSQNMWILVDDGLGALVPSSQINRIPNLIQLAGVTLEEIEIVAITHFHTDHTGWNVNATKENSVLFPNAQYMAQLDEINYWSSSGELQNTSNFQNLIQPVINAGLLQPVQGVKSLTDEVQLIPCKGHTPGHQCVEINSLGETAIIIGDAMHHPAQIQKPDWSSVFDWNTVYSIPLRKSLISQIYGNNVLLIAGHFPFPGIGNIIEDPNANPNTSGLIYNPIIPM
jgi:glyoxylase-like metal-dependent hydrolase (beta-lactamase superfamily II)